jgi:hypothetical protein
MLFKRWKITEEGIQCLPGVPHILNLPDHLVAVFEELRVEAFARLADQRVIVKGFAEAFEPSAIRIPMVTIRM